MKTEYSETIDNRFIKFIKKHHVLTLATSVNDLSWCCSCFYVYDEIENRFIFSSDTDTKHIQNAIINPNVSANIYLETKIIGNIQGIQVTGLLKQLNGEIETIARKIYLKKFPFAILINTSLWAIYANTLKLTDNKLGFGKKLIWQK